MEGIKCKSILTKSKLPLNDYVFNPYIGCTHSCKYCYAEFMKKFTNHKNDEWGKYIDYKENAIEILKEEIKKIKKEDKIFFGSVTDVYQPIEKKLEITREALKIFLEYDLNISILTKSDLVVRDIDLLKQFKNIEIGISLGCVNEEITKILEPGAKSPQSRIEAIKLLKQDNIRTYTFMSPIIPYLAKLEENFKAVYMYSDYVMGEILNTKTDSMKNFKEIITKSFSQEKTNKIFTFLSNEKNVMLVKEEFDRLCIKYNVENKGFFIHKN